jgi:hypothetical protein
MADGPRNNIMDSFERLPLQIRDLAADIFDDIEKIPDTRELQDKFADLMAQIALAWYPRVH